MSHVRQQIREQVVTLCTGLTTTGSRVYDTRLYNLDSDDLPGLVIYTQNESSTKSTLSPSTYERELDVLIEGYAQANNDIEDTLDTISKEVEDAIGADPLLNGKAVDSELTSTEIEFTSIGESPIGILRLTYRVLYMTLSTNASTPQ
jgi:hypothetical protein